MTETLKNKKTKSYTQYGVKRNWQLLAMLSGAIVFTAVFAYIPMYGVLIAFQEYNPALGIGGSPYIGLDNFTRFFESYQFSNLMINTFLVSFLGFIIGFPLPIIIALLLNTLRSTRMKGIFQTIFNAPHFISVVVLVGMLFLFFGEYGLINSLVLQFGGERISFFLESDWFRPLFIGSGNWQETGWSSIIYLAALAGVDPQLHEAAKIDGASRFKRILHIDFPAIFPTISIILILSVGSLLSVGYEKVLLMQTGTNLSTSEIISTYVYKIGLTGFTEPGYAAAIGLFNSLINVVLLIIANYSAKKFSENSLW
ncbi:MAG: ABC transporter permease subunit [Paracholeplasma sp.]|nr:ABC transporter permease subunit [Paracholeplasma sp.]MDY3196346.1 ABC transporter permease subunit [Paracholeplasma sp.]